MNPPVTRYCVSKREYPEQLPKIEYGENDIVRRVNTKGIISFCNKRFFISEALKREYIALKPIDDGQYNVYFCDQKIDVIDLRNQYGKQ